MNHWIPLIATSVGVALGALLSFVAQWLHFRRQRSAESRTLRLTKLEELYAVLTEIRQHYIELHTKYTNRLLLPASARPASDDASANTPIPLARMQMLTTIYAPSLQSDVDRIMALRNELGDIFVDSISADDSAESERDALWKKQCDASERLEAVVNDARANVAELAATMVD